MPWIVVCYGSKGGGKCEQQRIELGMSVEDYTAFCKEQNEAWNARMEARKVLEAAIVAHTEATLRYHKSCIIPEKYQ